MPEIYMRKKAFWKEEQNKKQNFITVIALVMIGLISILIFLKYDKDTKPNVIKISNTKIPTQSLKILQIINRKIKLIKSLDFIVKNKETDAIKIIKYYNPITQSNLNDEYYWNKKFLNNLQSLIFDRCQSNILSQEIELYYNFYFNRKISNFEIANEYTDDSHIINDKICFSSGKANIALKTLSSPRCIEFKNFLIGNFYNRISLKNNSNILFKFNIFKVKNNKIHIYPIAKQLLTFKHIQKYYEIKEDNLDIPYTDKNLIIYEDSVTEDKYFRVCNLMPLKESEPYYENKFWLEINWDPDIQNMICLSEFYYLS